MSAESPDFELPLGVVAGQTRPASARPIKNGRWFLVRHDLVREIGWGDLSFDDMTEIAEGLGTAEAVVVLPEHLSVVSDVLAAGVMDAARITGEGFRCSADKPPGAIVAALGENAWYVLLSNKVLFVDAGGLEDRSGWVRRPLGYRYTDSGERHPTGEVRLRAIGPEELLTRLTSVLVSTLE